MRSFSSPCYITTFHSSGTRLLYNFICDDFFDDVLPEYELTENEPSGKSKLDWVCKNKENSCISNFDKKRTDFLFFKTDASLHLYKRVDHVVFEINQHQTWDVHLIEMKVGVESSEKWTEIKGKFRASYLTIKAIAGILDLETKNFYFYTTYEHASFMSEKENTATRKMPIGKKVTRPEDEWAGGKFGLNIGDRLPFKHTPLKMLRNDDGVLVQEK